MAAPPNSQVAPLPHTLPFRLVSKTIGQGAYASIRKAIPKNASSPVVAVKFINHAHAFRHGRLTPKQLQLEIALHAHVGQHPNVIEQFANGEDAGWTWIAMELAEGGDLFDKIEADIGVGPDIAHFYFTQLVNAVAFCHGKGVAHRDIKPENMLVSAQGDLKVADFGLATLYVKDGRRKLSTTVLGSPPYMAPEVAAAASHRTADRKGYEPNVADLWSVGVVLFVLLVGNTPWDAPTRESWEFNHYLETNGRPTEDELWDKVAPDQQSLLRGLLKVDAADRFDLDMIRKHPWFTRTNPYLTDRGMAANPIGLATAMLENLKIDFNHDDAGNISNTPVPASQNSTAMDVDSPPIADHFAAATQPETPLDDNPFDWERPSYVPDAMVSASQPTDAHTSRVSRIGNNITARTGILSDAHSAMQTPTASQQQLTTLSQAALLSHLSQHDPSLSQFSQNPTVPLSLTQAAHQFADIVPASSLTRFLSSWPIAYLLSSLQAALHALNLSVHDLTPAELDQATRDQRGWIRIKVQDGRRQGLSGTIVVEAVNAFGMEDLSGDEAGVLEVRFVKAKGDPLEWRRLFKRVVVKVKDGVLIPS